MRDTVLDPDLILAYLNTEYRVESDPPIVLKVGARTPALAWLMASHDVDSCMFLTACNPYSQLLDPAENRERQDGLAKELTAHGLEFMPGVGADPRGEWPPESSYLVFGLSLEAAKALAARHEQNAIVWCGADTIPQLVLLK